MLVDIRYRGLEGLQDHLAVLLADDLVADATSREDGLFPDCLDLGQDLPAFCLQY